MAAQADSNRVVVTYGIESTWGQAVAATTELPINSTSLEHQKRTVISERLRQDRMVPGILEVGAGAGGGIPLELSFADFDPMVRSVTGGVGNPIVNGITGDTFFTLQESFLDVGHGLELPGMYVNTFGLNIASEAIIRGEIAFIGKEGIPGVAGSIGTPASDNPIMTATANVGSLKEGGSELASAVRAVSFTLNANRAGRPAVKHRTPVGIRAGQFQCSGTMEAYFEDRTLLEKFVNHTLSSLEIGMTDSLGQTINCLFPAIRYTGSPINVQGVNQDVLTTLAWQAERDPVTDSMFKWTNG